ncbi:MAG: hypothetical protein AABZ09_06965 [Candidatus Binatota bacterium]
MENNGLQKRVTVALALRNTKLGFEKGGGVVNRKWLCITCHALLGQEQESSLHIRYREDVQILVEGRDFQVTRVCRRPGCGTLNVWRVEGTQAAHQ